MLKPEIKHALATMAVWPKVSVVIVSWNAKDYLAECLESLGGEVYAGTIETIVVDNASTDGSVDMVRIRFPHVKLICNSANIGFARANNIGIRNCVGEYVALINSDVHVLPDCITNLVSYCQAEPAVGLVGPLINGGDGKQQLSCRAAPSLWNMFCRAVALDVVFPRTRWFNGYFLGHWGHRTTAEVAILSGCFWLAKRTAVDEVGLLDECFFMYGEDMDWCKRFRDIEWKIIFVAQAHAIHYGGGSSANAPLRFFLERQKADVQYWRKHHSRLAVTGYCVVALLHHVLRVIGHSVKACIGRENGARFKVQRSVACIRWLLQTL